MDEMTNREELTRALKDLKLWLEESKTFYLRGYITHIDEAIDYLSIPLPDDAVKFIAKLRNNEDFTDTKAADMLERQQGLIVRLQWMLEGATQRGLTAEQHIKELEHALKLANQDYDTMCEEDGNIIAELKQRIEELVKKKAKFRDLSTRYYGKIEKLEFELYKERQYVTELEHELNDARSNRMPT